MKYLDQLYLAEVLVKPMAECLFSELSNSNISTEYQQQCHVYKLRPGRLQVLFKFWGWRCEPGLADISLLWKIFIPTSYLPELGVILVDFRPQQNTYKYAFYLILGSRIVTRSC